MQNHLGRYLHTASGAVVSALGPLPGGPVAQWRVETYARRLLAAAAFTGYDSANPIYLIGMRAELVATQASHVLAQTTRSLSSANGSSVSSAATSPMSDAVWSSVGEGQSEMPTQSVCGLVPVTEDTARTLGLIDQTSGNNGQNLPALQTNAAGEVDAATWMKTTTASVHDTVNAGAYGASVVGLILGTWGLFGAFPDEWEAGALGKTHFATAAAANVGQLGELVGTAARNTKWLFCTDIR